LIHVAAAPADARACREQRAEMCDALVQRHSCELLRSQNAPQIPGGYVKNGHA
jgi:hypothetical protein